MSWSVSIVAGNAGESKLTATWKESDGSIYIYRTTTTQYSEWSKIVNNAITARNAWQESKTTTSSLEDEVIAMFSAQDVQS